MLASEKWFPDRNAGCKLLRSHTLSLNLGIYMETQDIRLHEPWVVNFKLFSHLKVIRCSAHKFWANMSRDSTVSSLASNAWSCETLGQGISAAAKMAGLQLQGSQVDQAGLANCCWTSGSCHFTVLYGSYYIGMCALSITCTYDKDPTLSWQVSKYVVQALQNARVLWMHSFLETIKRYNSHKNQHASLIDIVPFITSDPQVMHWIKHVCFIYASPYPSTLVLPNCIMMHPRAELQWRWSLRHRRHQSRRCLGKACGWSAMQNNLWQLIYGVQSMWCLCSMPSLLKMAIRQRLSCIYIYIKSAEDAETSGNVSSPSADTIPAAPWLL